MSGIESSSTRRKDTDDENRGKIRPAKSNCLRDILLFLFFLVFFVSAPLVYFIILNPGAEVRLVFERGPLRRWVYRFYTFTNIHLVEQNDSTKTSLFRLGNPTTAIVDDLIGPTCDELKVTGTTTLSSGGLRGILSSATRDASDSVGESDSTGTKSVATDTAIASCADSALGRDSIGATIESVRQVLKNDIAETGTDYNMTYDSLVDNLGAHIGFERGKTDKDPYIVDISLLGEERTLINAEIKGAEANDLIALIHLPTFGVTHEIFRKGCQAAGAVVDQDQDLMPGSREESSEDQDHNNNICPLATMQPKDIRSPDIRRKMALQFPQWEEDAVLKRAHYLSELIDAPTRTAKLQIMSKMWSLSHLTPEEQSQERLLSGFDDLALNSQSDDDAVAAIHDDDDQITSSKDSKIVAPADKKPAPNPNATNSDAQGVSPTNSKPNTTKVTGAEDVKVKSNNAADNMPASVKYEFQNVIGNATFNEQGAITANTTAPGITSEAISLSETQRPTWVFYHCLCGCDRTGAMFITQQLYRMYVQGTPVEHLLRRDLSKKDEGEILSRDSEGRVLIKAEAASGARAIKKNNDNADKSIVMVTNDGEVSDEVTKLQVPNLRRDPHSATSGDLHPTEEKRRMERTKSENEKSNPVSALETADFEAGLQRAFRDNSDDNRVESLFTASSGSVLIPNDYEEKKTVSDLFKENHKIIGRPMAYLKQLEVQWFCEHLRVLGVYPHDDCVVCDDHYVRCHPMGHWLMDRQIQPLFFTLFGAYVLVIVVFELIVYLTIKLVTGCYCQTYSFEDSPDSERKTYPSDIAMNRDDKRTPLLGSP